jgi:hypothetical protein
LRDLTVNGFQAIAPRAQIHVHPDEDILVLGGLRDLTVNGFY